MPIYLDENYFASDAALVGFPHLVFCMGFVAVVNDGTNRTMWGVHLVGLKDSATAFPFFAAELLKTATAKQIKAIYGCCNRAVRYGRTDNATWKAEMMAFAKMLGYNGPAYGFDTGIIDPREGTYVQYELRDNADSCRIFYRQNDRMKFTHPDGTQRTLGKRIVLQNAKNINDFPVHTRNNPKVIALTLGNRIEDKAYGTIDATPTTPKPSKTAQLKEVDYSLRLTVSYVVDGKKRL
jgi:hypothetical protein